MPRRGSGRGPGPLIARGPRSGPRRRSRRPPAAASHKPPGLQPVVTTSSISTIQRPAERPGASSSSRQPERPGDVAGPGSAVEVELAGGGSSRVRGPGRRAGRALGPRPWPAARPGRSRARAPAPAWIGTGTIRSPPADACRQRVRQRPAERFGQAPLAGVLQGVERRPDRAGNGAHHSSWSSGAGTSPRRPIATPPGSSSRASSAGRQAGRSGSPSSPHPDAGGRQARSRARSSACHRPGPGGRLPPHRRWMPSGASLPRCRRSSASPPHASGEGSGSRRPRSRCGRSCRPAARATPLAPRTQPARCPRHGGSARRTARTVAAAVGLGLADEDGVDREAHEHHVDPVLPGSHRPSPAASDRRPIRPMNLAHSESADSTLLGEDVRRSTLRTRSSRAARQRRRLDAAGRDRPSALAGLEVLDDQDDGRPEDDDEQRREDAADEREQHLDRRLGGLLLGALAALDAELLGLDLEHLARSRRRAARPG